MHAGVMDIWLEIVPWIERRLEKGRKGRKVRGKECGVEKGVKVIGKEKEREREIMVEKETRGTPREKEKVKARAITGERQPGERGIKGIVTSVERRDIRLERDCARFKR